MAEKKIKVRAISKLGDRATFRVKVNGKEDVIFPNEHLEVGEKEFERLNTLNNEWKFEKEEK